MPAGLDADRDGQGQGGEGLGTGGQPSQARTAEWMPPLSSPMAARISPRAASSGLRRSPLRSAPRDLVADHGDGEGEREQALLGAVAQLAFDLAPLVQPAAGKHW